MGLTPTKSKFESILKSIHSASEALKMEIVAAGEASMREGYVLGMRRTDAIAVTQTMLSIGKVRRRHSLMPKTRIRH